MTDDLTWMPAHEIRKRIGEKRLSPITVVDHFLDRIARLEPSLHAFDVVDAAGARKQAALAQKAIDDGAGIGPLHGIPIGIMDAIKIKGYRSRAWRIESVAYDSICVERLRKAGAIILGSTATYNWEPLDRPRNPWDISKDPGNSSRGSAVAVAAGMVPVAIGMDGLGSTRLPASWCGLVGVNTSRGLIAHVDYENPSQTLTLNLGPMARNAKDCALVLQAIAGRDGRDFISEQASTPDYLAHIDDGLHGLRIAWTDDFGWTKPQWVDESAELVQFAKRAAFGLTDKGAVVSETDARWEDGRSAMFMLGKVAGAMGYVPPVDLEELSARMRKVDEAWGWPVSKEAATFAGFPEATAEQYRVAAELRASIADTFYRVLQDHDVIMSLTTPMQPRSLAEWGLSGRQYLMSSYTAHTGAINLIGFAAVSVPCGLLHGFPVGLQVIGRPGSEDMLLRVAEAVQQAYPILEHPPAAG